MKLADALRDIQYLTFDTAPLIYFVERHPVYFDRMLFIMRYIDSKRISGVASTVALTAVLVQPLRIGDSVLAQRYEAVLTHSDSFRLEPVTAQIAEIAASLRARYNLRTPDALHVATALDSGCDAFLTNDEGIKCVTDMRVLVLDEQELPAPTDQDSERSPENEPPAD